MSYLQARERATIASSSGRRTAAITCEAHIDNGKAILGHLQLQRFVRFIALFGSLRDCRARAGPRQEHGILKERQEASKMPVIHPDSSLCTVIVTVDAPSRVLPELERHAKDGLRRFRDFEGFIGGALHRSDDGTRLVQYLQWRSEQDHLACMNDPRWDAEPSARRFMELAQEGTATVDVRTYDVVAAEDTTPEEGSIR
jgi:hypothetical protein